MNPELELKTRSEVLITFEDGTNIKGTFFISEKERITDILNDNRKFIPFEDKRGFIKIINKSKIISVEPSEQR